MIFLIRTNIKNMHRFFFGCSSSMYKSFLSLRLVCYQDEILPFLNNVSPLKTTSSTTQFNNQVQQLSSIPSSTILLNNPVQKQSSTNEFNNRLKQTRSILIQHDLQTHENPNLSNSKNMEMLFSKAVQKYFEKYCLNKTVLTHSYVKQLDIWVRKFPTFHSTLTQYSEPSEVF